MHEARRRVRLFDLQPGQVADLVIEQVGSMGEDCGIMVDRLHPCRAQATDQYATIAGEVRRLFVNVDPPVDGTHRELWMADAVDNLPPDRTQLPPPDIIR